MTFPTVPVLLAGGVVTLLVLSRSKPVAPTPTPAPPGPTPIPPGPVPTPVTPETAALLAQMAAMVQLATQNPAAADPAQMDALADRLQAAGLIEQANGLRLFAAQVRASRAVPTPPMAPPAVPPIPTPATPPMGVPSRMPPAIAARMQNLLTDMRADPNELEDLANQIAVNFPGSFLTQITQLRERARFLRSLRI